MTLVSVIALHYKVYIILHYKDHYNSKIELRTVRTTDRRQTDSR